MTTTDLTRPSYTVRDFQAEDEENVLGLLRLTLGDGGSFSRTTDFWRWKHFQNPFGVSQLLVAANHEVLGLRAFMRWGFKTPTGRLSAVRAVDTSTHLGYQRMGIFSRLTQASLERAKAEGVNMIFNTPNPRSMAGYLKLGWQAVGRPRLMIKPLNLLRMAPALLLKPRTKLPPDAVPDFFRSAPRPVDAVFDHADRVGQMLEFDDGLHAQGIRTERSLAYLRWRYGAAPSLSYFAFWTGDRPVTGLTIFRPNVRNGLREIMLCEFLIGYGAAPHARELIGQLARLVRADYLVAAATPGTYHWGTLRRAGFITLPPQMGPNLTVLRLNWPDGALDPHRLENWQLSLGDLEIF